MLNVWFRKLSNGRWNHSKVRGRHELPCAHNTSGFKGGIPRPQMESWHACVHPYRIITIPRPPHPTSHITEVTEMEVREWGYQWHYSLLLWTLTVTPTSNATTMRRLTYLMNSLRVVAGSKSSITSSPSPLAGKKILDRLQRWSQNTLVLMQLSSDTYQKYST